jgi:hypothetical protein
MPREGDPVSIVQEVGWALGPVWRDAKNISPPEFDPRTVQPVANCYAACAIPAYSCWWMGPNICGIGSWWHKTHTWKCTCNNVCAYSTGVC